MSTLHCTLEIGVDLYVNVTSVRRYDTIALGLLKKEERRMPNGDFFTSPGAYVNCTIIAMLYNHLIGNQP